MTSVWQRIARLFTTAADRSNADATDIAMMARCIALSREAVDAGEYPFACVIAKGDEVVVEATNRVARDREGERKGRRGGGRGAAPGGAQSRLPAPCRAAGDFGGAAQGRHAEAQRL